MKFLISTFARIALWTPSRYELFNSSTKKSNAIKAVRMLNGEIVRNKLKTRTLTDYRKQLLGLGVNYIYVEHPISKISQAMLDKAIYKTGNFVIE